MAATRLTLRERIEYLEAAVECAWIMYNESHPRGFDGERDKAKLYDHLDSTLESLLVLYLERDAAIV